MKLRLQQTPCLNSFFHCGMISTMKLALMSKVSHPFTTKSMKFDASMTTFVPRRGTSVLSIFSVCTFAKVLNYVVGAISINVVNTITGPNSVMVKPNKTMGSVMFFLMHYNPISIIFYAASKSAWSNFATTSGNLPVKIAVGIRKSFKKFIMCNHMNIYQITTLIVKNKGATSAGHL